MDSHVAGQLTVRFAQAHEVLGRRWHRRVELLGRAHGPVADDRQSAHDGVPDTGLVEVAQGGANSFIAVARGRSRPGSSRRLRRAGPADRAARPRSTRSAARRRSPPSGLRVPARRGLPLRPAAGVAADRPARRDGRRRPLPAGGSRQARRTRTLRRGARWPWATRLQTYPDRRHLADGGLLEDRPIQRR